MSKFCILIQTLSSFIAAISAVIAAIYYFMKIKELKSQPQTYSNESQSSKSQSSKSQSSESQSSTSGFKKPFPGLVVICFITGGAFLIFLIVAMTYYGLRFVPQEIPFILDKPFTFTKFWACMFITPYFMILVPLLMITIIDLAYLFEINNIHPWCPKFMNKYLVPKKKTNFTYARRIKFILILSILSSLLAWLPYVFPTFFDI